MTTNPADHNRVARDLAWPANSSACSRAYLVAAMRAGVIALILLAVLALVVLL